MWKLKVQTMIENAWRVYELKQYDAEYPTLLRDYFVLIAANVEDARQKCERILGSDFCEESLCGLGKPIAEALLECFNTNREVWEWLREDDHFYTAHINEQVLNRYGNSDYIKLPVNLY